MNLRKILYPKVEPIVKKIVASLILQGITPNQLTVAGAVLSFLTGVIYAKGYFFLGGFFLIIAGAGDLLDGALAREAKKESKFGAFFDSVLDRYSDFFIFSGLAVGFFRIDEPFWAIVTLLILLGAVAVSYAKARAENFIENCSVGLFGRAERVIILAIASILIPILKIALLALLIGTHATAIKRILHTKKELEEKSHPSDNSQP